METVVQPTGKMLTPGEVATRLRVKKPTVLEMARRGRLPSIRLTARVIRFDETAINRVLAETARP